ncbi:hypothetical protein PGT21_000944 [Puccinia graminis f. sp. tritici]|uniref:Uncharacterized protein n=2 Tax=Puccinia graminis f. sp. tritici TaxID=56615 RepID=H6QRX2_PUCGT|nr:uncharacterized protein PGTG_21587 [Puccinia graminis f. sp. tritici CRL 75-36-700-3]EHS63456.1 hypothetical protein PGTG_21587 [Puccinia graminis f. sp. tritici CRL 75-36-700-3]KAA1066441.1 hypothetical protein PGT21_030573 [Puccinia graminis f. sp. tritici]KAA1085053.1 hypothetical protein PGT21_000944 [Puccinia graminis f. sp. tritici]
MSSSSMVLSDGVRIQHPKNPPSSEQVGTLLDFQHAKFDESCLEGSPKRISEDWPQWILTDSNVGSLEGSHQETGEETYKRVYPTLLRNV